MTRQEIASLVCKSLAIFLIGWAIVTMPAVIMSIVRLSRTDGIDRLADMFSDSLWMLAPTMAMVFVGWFIWVFSDSLASRMVDDNEEPASQVSVSIVNITSIVFSACGIFVLIAGVQTPAAPIWTAIYYDMGSDYVLGESEFWVGAAQIALGAWLIFGSRGIVGFIHRLRNFRTLDDMEKTETGESSEYDPRPQN